MTRSQNEQNKGLQANNSTGARGVSVTRTGRFRVQIYHRGRRAFSGNFDTFAEAEHVAREVRAQLHTHATDL